MENKFKPGDRVICIASGEEYVIYYVPEYLPEVPGTMNTINNYWKKAYHKDYVCVEPEGWEHGLAPAFYAHEIRLTNSGVIKKRLGII